MSLEVKSSLQMAIRPIWDEVERVRHQTMQYLAAHGFSDDTVQSLGMVASELCENAIKYGSFPDLRAKHIEILIRPGESRNRVLVRVTGPVQIGNNPHFRRFKETLDWLQEHENPMEAYLERMQLAAWTTPTDDESGLGLPRIAYEGQSLLSYELDDQDRLAVCAIHYPDRD